MSLYNFDILILKVINKNTTALLYTVLLSVLLTEWNQRVQHGVASYEENFMKTYLVAQQIFRAFVRAIIFFFFDRH